MISSKQLDKFYTSGAAAASFIEFVQKYISFDDYDNILEPSAGAGSLLNHLPSNAIGIDLIPERDDITQCDFFDYEYPTGKTLTIGNPPFGARSKLAVEFFNKAAKHSDAIAFIIPVTWEKYNIQSQLAEGWSLVATVRLPEQSFELDGEPYRVRCCMQMWLKDSPRSIRKMSKEVGVHSDFTFVNKKDDWDFCMSGSPAIVRSKEYFVEKDGKFCSIFIKANVPDLFETFNTIAWQSAEAKQILGGSRFPVADTEDVVKVYEMFMSGHLPAKKGDWRRQKERAKVRKLHTYKD